MSVRLANVTDLHSTGDSSEIATSTLAAIYEKQGLYERALGIWRRLARRAPGDPRITERIEALSRQIETAREEGETPEPEASMPAEPDDEEPPVDSAREPEPAPEPGEDRPPAAPPPPPDDDERFLAWLEKK